jgi:hypothetical protein
MPYKRQGKVIYHKIKGKWSIKQRASSVDNAKAAMRILLKVEREEKQ